MVCKSIAPYLVKNNHFIEFLHVHNPVTRAFLLTSYGIKHKLVYTSKMKHFPTTSTFPEALSPLLFSSILMHMSYMFRCFQEGDRPFHFVQSFASQKLNIILTKQHSLIRLPMNLTHHPKPNLFPPHEHKDQLQQISKD